MLNPCATAIEAPNVSRVRHLLCVLQELQSFSGDANHRLAAYELRALLNHLSCTGISISNIGGAEALPIGAHKIPRGQPLVRLTQRSRQRLHPPNVSPRSEPQRQDPSRGRLGVSHGLQWPTFLDAIARRPEGGPPRVRLTRRRHAAWAVLCLPAGIRLPVPSPSLRQVHQTQPPDR